MVYTSEGEATKSMDQPNTPTSSTQLAQSAQLSSMTGWMGWEAWMEGLAGLQQPMACLFIHTWLPERCKGKKSHSQSGRTVSQKVNYD